MSTTPDPVVIGKVASPPGKEATSEEFHFWFPQDKLVEKGQIIRTEIMHRSVSIKFYGVVKEVYRQSRFRSLAEEHDRYDGQTGYTPPFEIPGVNFAHVSILRTEPNRLCPPQDGTDVLLGTVEDARYAWRADEIRHPLRVGLIRNGGTELAGPGSIDLDYLLGANGGHLNVNGVAGRATKSAFLLHMLALLLHEARRQALHPKPGIAPLKVVPIILNVKNFDLFHIDRPSRNYCPERDTGEWQQLGIDEPQPFQSVTWLAPDNGNGLPVQTGRMDGNVTAYSYALKDVIQRGLFQYLFSEDDRSNENFQLVVLWLEGWLTRETTSGRDLQQPDVRTFDDLLKKVSGWAENGGCDNKSILTATWRMFHRRLLKLLLEGRGVLQREKLHGQPLNVVRKETTNPQVIDLSALARQPLLQKFVVGAIFQQLRDARTGSDLVPGLVYLVMLDELNRFAPKGGGDPVTKLMEHIAAEMRSQGIILLGAQQQASLVSGRVIENAGVRAVGKSGSLELSDRVWKFLSPASRSKASQLQPDEKLLIQDSFREPMLVKIPHPPWAMRQEEAVMPVIKPEALELEAP